MICFKLIWLKARCFVLTGFTIVFFIKHVLPSFDSLVDDNEIIRRAQIHTELKPVSTSTKPEAPGPLQHAATPVAINKLEKLEQNQITAGYYNLSGQRQTWSIPINSKHIDCVITHVNGSDPVFRVQLKEALACYTNVARFADTDNRFQDHDDLKILLRSIDKYGKMFRKVFLVVAGESQIPVWLNRSAPKLQIVFHDQIWNDPSQLPVFNSLAIEANLHHIEGLSDAFVYFNDDLALLNELTIADFFAVHRRDRRQRAIKFRTSVKIRDDLKTAAENEKHWIGPAIATRNATKTQCDLARSLGRQLPTVGFVPNHVPHFMLRSVMYRVEEDPALAELFKRTSAYKFRSGQELNPVMLFYMYIQCFMNLSVFWVRRLELFYRGVDLGIQDEAALTQLKKDLKLNARRIKTKAVKFLCINDVSESGNTTALGIKSMKLVNEWRLQQFPERSVFEK